MKTSHWRKAIIVSSAFAMFAAFSPAQAADKVNVAIIGGTSDIGLYVAQAKGWFKEEGLEVSMTRMASGARMIGPMSTGDLDVGTGAIAAGFYNAILRGIKVRVVAGKGSNVKGMSFQGLMVRKDLYDSGKIRKISDLIGSKFAFTGPAAADSATIDIALKPYGKGFKDVQAQYLGLAAQVSAYVNKAIDASIMPEPFRSTVITRGLAVQLTPVGDIRDGQMVGGLQFGDKFATERRDVAMRFIKAYVRGLRFYLDSLKDGKIAGKNADEVIDILATYSSLKDKAVLRNIVPTAMDPNGDISLKTMREDLAFFKSIGAVKGDIQVENVVDRSFVEAAIKALGPYKRAE